MTSIAAVNATIGLDQASTAVGWTTAELALTTDGLSLSTFQVAVYGVWHITCC